MVFHILKRTPAAVLLGSMMVCAAALAQEEFEGLSDPMRPYDIQVRSTDVSDKAPVAESTTLLLQSIVVGATERYAIINGERVRVGSIVDNAYVEEIRPRHVIVVRGARREVLPLLGAGTDGGAWVKKEVANE